MRRRHSLRRVQGWVQTIRDCRLTLSAEFLQADEATSIREHIVKTLDVLLEELFRTLKKIKPTDLTAAQFYDAIAKVARAENAIMSEAQLDIIQGMLEEAEQSVQRTAGGITGSV